MHPSLLVPPLSQAAALTASSPTHFRLPSRTRPPCPAPNPLCLASLPCPGAPQEAEWKHTTRCVLVGIVGGTALLLAMVVPVALLWFIRHGVPLDRLGDVSRLKEGECLELQERMLCRRELDDFRL